jgi:hypothetical protein
MPDPLCDVKKEFNNCQKIYKSYTYFFNKKQIIYLDWDDKQHRDKQTIQEAFSTLLFQEINELIQTLENQSHLSLVSDLLNIIDNILYEQDAESFTPYEYPYIVQEILNEIGKKIIFGFEPLLLPLPQEHRKSKDPTALSEAPILSSVSVSLQQIEEDKSLDEKFSFPQSGLLPSTLFGGNLKKYQKEKSEQEKQPSNEASPTSLTNNADNVCRLY